MNETIHWTPYRQPGHAPEEFRARGTPWTTGAPRRKREDEYGPLPDLNSLKRNPLPERGRERPKLPGVTEYEMAELRRTQIKLHQQLARHPDREPVIKQKFEFFRSFTAAKRRGEHLVLADHLKAMSQTGVGE